MVDTGHCTFVKNHRTYNTKSDVSVGSWVVTNLPLWPGLLIEVEAGHVGGAGVDGNALYFLFIFFYEPKPSLKNKFLKNNK